MICNPFSLAVSSGFKAHNYEILVDRPGRLVAKLNGEQESALLKADTTPMEMSWDEINIKRLAQSRLPVPAILARGEEPLSYILLSWIEGESLTSDSPLSAQLEAGRLLHRVHHLEDSPPLDRPGGWDGWMKGWLNVALPWWGDQPGVSSAMVDGAWRGFERLRPLLATRGTHYMLQDGRPEHFIVRDGHIVGLIDVHDAQPGDGGMDLGVIGVMEDTLLPNVRRGYPADAAENEILDQLIPFYIFLRQLAAAEWNSRHGFQSLAKIALARANDRPFP